ncbi:hypothetical protein N7532_003935 [Penicillium argentinense]|uniref:Uncharacterized protein n=1 Tax=Penicillium argentinense TaxID=1131581 RepID=A0A9W9FND1_9EURO|nr:uncharacterized protein N7532_003935 [Penicillium argentinense]KAJ5103406.1 hypothetical protein N7532_003935 [Penicillium argentinense]
MLFMLNVIMYAGQLRRMNNVSTLEEQRKLIQMLLKNEQESEAKYTHLTRSIQMIYINDDAGPIRATASTTTFTVMGTAAARPNPILPASLDRLSPSIKADVMPEFSAYEHIIQKFLTKIDMCQSTLEEARRQRIRNGIMKLHATEVAVY